MPKVSAIIPLYNAENYIARCLDSLIHQTLVDIEIIVLNDGSTDQSEQIVLDQFMTDARVKYVKHENRGQGRTRNRGIELATGEYLSFIDADDWITSDMFEKLYLDAVAHQVDVICCEHFQYREQEEPRIYTKFQHHDVVSIEKDGAAHFFGQYFFKGKYFLAPWAKLFRTDLVKKHDIQFADNRRIYEEDRYFNLRVLMVADQICFHPAPYYHYILRQGSVVNSYTPHHIRRQLTMLDDLYAQQIDSRRSDVIKKVISLYLTNVVSLETKNIVNYRRGFKEFFASIQTLQNHRQIDTYLHMIIEEKAYEVQQKLRFKRSSLVSMYLLRYRLALLNMMYLYMSYGYRTLKNESKNSVKKIIRSFQQKNNKIDGSNQTILNRLRFFYRTLTAAWRMHPSFMIIGAQKGGTTSLYRYLIQNPQITASFEKEIHYFSFMNTKGERWYRAHFPISIIGKSSLVFDASPSYLADSHAPLRIYQKYPHMKFIVLLRNPVDRAYSAYQHYLSRNMESRQFKDIYIQCIRSKQTPHNLHHGKNTLRHSRDDNNYFKNGRYVKQISRWLQYFPREQFYIVSSEQFYENTPEVLRKISDFLEIPYFAATKFKIYNPGTYQDCIDPHIREELADYYEPYNQALYQLLGTDYGWR